jgi:hypothetical protein
MLNKTWAFALALALADPAGAKPSSPNAGDPAHLRLARPEQTRRGSR